MTALAAHEGQTRKGSSTPYIVHPLHVATMLARAGADEETIQAGVLHDVVEDCEGWTLERLEDEFGPRVREIVAHLTEDKSTLPDSGAPMPPIGIVIVTIPSFHVYATYGIAAPQ